MKVPDSQIGPAKGSSRHVGAAGDCNDLSVFLTTVLTTLCLAGSTILSCLSSTSAMLMLLVATGLPGGVVHAQSLQPQAAPGSDTVPPIIELETIESGVAGQDQVFTALVADDGDLLDVKLYFRYRGQQAYQTITMDPLADTSFYLVTLATPTEETRAIEYYVQARDIAGNRVVEGFAYEPLVRSLTPPENAPGSASTQTDTAAETTPAPEFQSESESGGIKVWQIVLGVLAVGALAGLAASSGGDDGGGGGGDPQQTVPLTITINTP